MVECFPLINPTKLNLDSEMDINLKKNGHKSCGALHSLHVFGLLMFQIWCWVPRKYKGLQKGSAEVR